MTLGIAATAGAWYWLIVKRVVRRRSAAFVGASLAAFAPPMVSHAGAHPNFVILFMIPLIIDRALRLCAGARVGGYFNGPYGEDRIGIYGASPATPRRCCVMSATPA